MLFLVFFLGPLWPRPSENPCLSTEAMANAAVFFKHGLDRSSHEVRRTVPEREAGAVGLSRRGAFSLLGAVGVWLGSGGSVHAEAPSQQERYDQIKRNPDLLAKIAALRSLRLEAIPDKDLRLLVFHDLWQLEYLAGDPAAVDTCRTLAQFSPREGTGLKPLTYSFISLLQWQQRYAEAERVWREEEAAVPAPTPADLQLLKQLLLAQGKYRELLALAPSSDPVFRALEHRIREWADFEDARGTSHRPFPLMNEAFFQTTSILGDRRSLSTTRDVPVRVFLNFTHARAGDLSLYMAFIRKDRKAVETFVHAVNNTLQEASGDRFSLKLVSVRFGLPMPAISGSAPQWTLDLAASPEVRSHTEGYTMFIGDFLPHDVMPVSAYIGDGLLLVNPIRNDRHQRNESFAPRKNVEMLAAHELAHSLGMLHMAGENTDLVIKNLIGEGHILETGEAGQLDDSLLASKTKPSLSFMNRLRMGWTLVPHAARTHQDNRLRLPAIAA